MHPPRNTAWYRVLSFSFASMLATEAVTKEAQDYTRCDPHLGSHFDESSPAERYARQNKYFICVTQQIYGRLQTGLREQIKELNEWRTRNGHTAQRSIRTNGKAAVSELKLMHSAQRMEINTDQANQLNQLVTAQTQNGRSERNELTSIFQAESREMNLRHNAERKELQNTIHGCASSVAREIKALWDDEFQSLTEQYQSKTARVGTRSSQIRNTPFDTSVSTYASSDSEPQNPVVDTPPPPPPAPDDSIDVSQSAEGTPMPLDDSAETISEGACRLIFKITSKIADGDAQPVSSGEPALDTATGHRTSDVSPLRDIFVYTSRLIDGEEEVEEVAISRHGST